MPMKDGHEARGDEDHRIDEDLDLGRLLAGDIGQHRDAGGAVVALLVERQRPEVRRGPEEDDEEQDDRGQRDVAGDGGPADHRREGAGGAADDDVLRRRALQPHRVDDGVEEDGEGEQRRPRPSWSRGRGSPPRSRSRRDRGSAPRSRLTRPAGIGRLAVRLMTASMSASYHMLRAPEPPAPIAMQRMAMTPTTGLMPPGASSRPMMAVKTTSDITRGLRSAK